MKLGARKILAAGAALILLTNIVALGGVAFNRSGTPDSRLTLSQRELLLPWSWGMVRESSGLAVGLAWRVNDASAGDYYAAGRGRGGGMPDWLDTARMAALGFDVSALPEDTSKRARIERSLPREVLLVLELAGPAWQQALERARANAARHEAARAANRDSKEFIDKAKHAQDQLRREETQNSRLFAIDAGLNRAALRARYPDRGRYLMLKATLRPRLVTHEGKPRLSGYVSALAVTQISIPHALRPTLEPVLRQSRRGVADSAPQFEAVLAVGQRLEPWIESVSLAR